MLGSKVVKSPAVGAGPSAFQASTDTPVHRTFDFLFQLLSILQKSLCVMHTMLSISNQSVLQLGNFEVG